MKAFLGTLALAVMLCLPVHAPARAAPPVVAPDDADQPPEGTEQPTKGTIQDVHLDRHAVIRNNTCTPSHVDFRGQIKTDGPAFVTYRWIRSDGTFKEGMLQFTKADVHPVGTDWNQTSTFSGWVRLIVLTPKHVETPKVYFTVHCGTDLAP